MEDDLRKLLIKMIHKSQEYEAQAKSSFMVIDAIKNMSPNERAPLTPENISQMQTQARMLVHPLVAEAAHSLLRDLQGEGDFLLALKIYLGP
jgi:hypothetical protein